MASIQPYSLHCFFISMARPCIITRCWKICQMSCSVMCNIFTASTWLQPGTRNSNWLWFHQPVLQLFVANSKRPLFTHTSMILVIRSHLYSQISRRTKRASCDILYEMKKYASFLCRGCNIIYFNMYSLAKWNIWHDPKDRKRGIWMIINYNRLLFEGDSQTQVRYSWHVYCCSPPKYYRFKYSDIEQPTENHASSWRRTWFFSTADDIIAFV